VTNSVSPVRRSTGRFGNWRSCSSWRTAGTAFGRQQLAGTPSITWPISRTGLDDIVAVNRILEPLSPESPISTAVLTESEASDPTGAVPYQALEPFHRLLEDADRYRAALPKLDDPRHLRLLYEYVLTEGHSAELIVIPELFETLREEYSRRMVAMADSDRFQLRGLEGVPDFGMALTRDGSEWTVSILVFASNGTVHGTIRNSTPNATAWAEEYFDERLDRSTDRTEELIADPHNGSDSVANTITSSMGQSLPVSLEAEGFRRLDASYFRETSVADPTTAWRTGLSLAEVHTGYSIERPAERPTVDQPTDPVAETPESERGLTETLVAEWLEGTDCLLIGSAGSGKSTICKRAACNWYESDTGSRSVSRTGPRPSVRVR